MQEIRKLAALKRQAAMSILLSAAVLAALSRPAGGWWREDGSLRWLAVSLSALAYFAAVLWRSLGANHRPAEEALLPGLGPANGLTMLRAVLMSAVAGFLFSPIPVGAFAWLPGALYTLASLPDFIDGIVARLTDSVTELGGILDMTVDSVGVLVATSLAVQYGSVPWWYLPIGLARYLFVFGLRLRERAGLPVHELPFSHRRRGFAALKMGFMFVMLFPLFGPPGTHLAAASFALPFAAGFLWDWALASGRPAAASGHRFRPLLPPVQHIAAPLPRFPSLMPALPLLPPRRVSCLPGAAVPSPFPSGPPALRCRYGMPLGILPSRAVCLFGHSFPTCLTRHAPRFRTRDSALSPAASAEDRP